MKDKICIKFILQSYYKLGAKNVLLNVVIPCKNKESEIDFIFERNDSTFVVEIKAYTGLITGKYNGKEWISYFGKTNIHL